MSEVIKFTAKPEPKNYKCNIDSMVHGYDYYCDNWQQLPLVSPTKRCENCDNGIPK